MQETSSLYKDIISQTNHWFEVSAIIGDTGRLIDTSADYILFGGNRILVESNSPDSGYRESMMFSLKTTQSLLNDTVVVGNCIAGEIDLKMLAPIANIPRMALIKPYVRATNGVENSEWLPKGTFFVDTREVTHNDNGLDVLTIHGFDAMLKAEEAYPSDTAHQYPLLDRTMVQFIADNLSVSVDERTWANMPSGYKFNLPVGFSMRETLSMIGVAYGGNWIITDEGMLRLVLLTEIPKETRYLIDNAGFTVRFGGDRILV